ncbi:MAG TPA: ATP-binding protein, partial [Kofleriaceae bacterium]
WPEPITRAAGCTLGDQHLVFGLSPRLPFDDSYRSFLVQLVEQIASALGRIDTADERKRILVQLEAASRAKDEFLAMLGHELRNPLAPIVTALELMRQKEAGASQERAIIERQVRHVIRLVDDLLDISKITRGLITLESRVVELADVVAAAVEASAHLVEQRRHQLSVDVARGFRVNGDEARLIQIVLNLLSNAARYTPPGGAIFVTADRDGDSVALRVRDTGAGIGPELLPKVFDLFVQGTRSADRAEGGLGLGLAIVKNLVELHSGSVTAESAGAGAGSTFTVRLPLAHVEKTAERATQRRVVAAADSRRVLVVDDNEDAANLLGEIARMRGHDVVIAHNAQTALEAIGTFQPQVAVLDIGLPVMDGYELATHVRSRFPDCRLIALTGYGQDKDRDRSLSAGFTAHLVKPVKVDTLLALLS